MPKYRRLILFAIAFVQAIKAKGALFISRGDNSGTHLAELKLWKDSGIDIKKEAGPWYKSIGQGMGAALNMGSSQRSLCDV